MTELHLSDGALFCYALWFKSLYIFWKWLHVKLKAVLLQKANIHTFRVDLGM